MQKSFYKLGSIISQVRSSSGNLMGFSTFGYMWTAVDSSTLVASHTIYAMLEKEAFSEFFTTQSWKNHVHPKDLHKLELAEEGLLKTGEPAVAEYRLITDTGKHIHVHHHMYLSGAPRTRQKIISIIHNITEDKRADVILEAMNEGFFELDENFTIRRINEHALKFWGLQQDETLRKKLSAVFPQIEGTVFQHILLTAQAEKINIAQDIQEPVTGHWLHLSVTPYADGLIVTFYDIQKEKEGEIQLLQLNDQLAKRAVDKYYSLFNSINQGFCIIEMIWDDDGNPVDYRFLETNPAFEKQTGIKDAAGRTMREIEPNYEPHWFNIYGEVAKTGKPIHFEKKTDPPMGGWYDIHAFPIEKETNRVALLFDNITERKNAEKALHDSEEKFRNQLQLEVQKQTEEIGKLNAELKQLNTITANNYTDALRLVYINLETIVTTDAKNLSNSSRANLRRAQGAIQKMKLLSNDINNYLQLYDTEIKKEIIDPSSILQNVLGSLQKKIEESNAKIIIHELPALYADQMLFSKLMTHLVDNSIKFRKQSTEPQISIGHLIVDQLVDLKTVREKTLTVISVSDNGIGFEKTDMIFEPFTQLHEQVNHKGAGMGLAICKKIMSMHGGFITADSKPGDGATFHCYFPDENPVDSNRSRT